MTNFGISHIDLVNDRHDCEIILECQPKVCHRLRLNTLQMCWISVNVFIHMVPIAKTKTGSNLVCSHDEQYTIAGRQRSRYLKAKVDMTRCVDQIEHVSIAIEH